MRIAYLGYVYESIGSNIINEGNAFKQSEYDLRRKYLENADGLYVTYRVGSRFGINHVHRHPNNLDTPKGIYCYQIHESYLPYNGGISIDRNDRNRELSDVENSTTGIMYVLRMKPSANKLDGSKYSDSDLESDKIKLAKLIGQELCSVEELKEFISQIQTKSKSKQNLKGTAFGLIWAYTMKYSYVNRSIDTSKWSMLLIKLGYDVIEDHGLGVIHWFEPSQAVFLTPSSYDIIDSADYGNDNIRQLNKLIELVSKDKGASNVRKNFRNISYYLMKILSDRSFNSDRELGTVNTLIAQSISKVDKNTEAYYAAMSELKPVFKKLRNMGYDNEDAGDSSDEKVLDAATIDIRQVEDIFDKLYSLEVLRPDLKPYLIHKIISKYGDSSINEELNSMIRDISKNVVLDYYRENYPERALSERSLAVRLELTVDSFKLNELDNSEIHRYSPILEKFGEAAYNILQTNLSKIRKQVYSNEANRALLLNNPNLLDKLNETPKGYVY